MEQPKKVNPFLDELNKFKSDDVEVDVWNGDEKETFSGKCKAIDYNKHSIILMTDDEKIFIPRYNIMRRKRNKQ